MTFHRLLSAALLLGITPLQAADKPAPAVTPLAPGHPDHAAILGAVRALPLIAGMEKDLGQKIEFDPIILNRTGDWAWFQGDPHSANRQWQGETLLLLLRQKDGQWTLHATLPDEVLSAEDYDSAYAKWRASLLRQNPGLNPALIPAE